jgi:hypothetical protein
LLHSAHASGLNENERQMYEYENGESVGLKWQRKTEVLKSRPFPAPPIAQ